MDFTGEEYDVFNKVVGEVGDEEEFERIERRFEVDKLLTLSELRFLDYYAKIGNDEAKQIMTEALENIYKKILVTLLSSLLPIPSKKNN